MQQVTSKDGTTIAFDHSGQGPALILVGGAFEQRAMDSETAQLAAFPLLAELLDRALALLPAESRRVLVEKYIDDLPLGEIAERMGVSAGTVAVRLHRSRLALRRVLATDVRQDAYGYGLAAPTDEGWQETRIWCPICGQRRLSGLRLVCDFGAADRPDRRVTQ